MNASGRRSLWIAALLLGIAAGAGHLVAESAGEPLWALLLKPIPVLLLLARVCVAESSALRWAVAAGLASSAVGDLLLQRPGGFLAGLVAFLLAHLAYTTGFWRGGRVLHPVRALPVALFGVAMASWIAPAVGGMALPVGVYIAAICLMMWRAAALVGTRGLMPAVGRAALAGAILFAASDSLIAIQRFVSPQPWANLPIMVLYWLGQSGIAAAAVLAARRIPVPAS